MSGQSWWSKPSFPFVPSCIFVLAPIFTGFLPQDLATFFSTPCTCVYGLYSSIITILLSIIRGGVWKNFARMWTRLSLQCLCLLAEVAVPKTGHFMMQQTCSQSLGSCDRVSWAKCEERENQQDTKIRYLNKDRPTWCHLLYYFTIYCSTCFGC